LLKERCRTHPAGPPEADGGIHQLKKSLKPGGLRGLKKTLSELSITSGTMGAGQSPY